MDWRVHSPRSAEASDVTAGEPFGEVGPYLRAHHEIHQSRQDQSLHELFCAYPGRVGSRLQGKQGDDPGDAEQDHTPVGPASTAEQRPDDKYVDDTDDDVANDPADYGVLKTLALRVSRSAGSVICR